MEAVGKMSTNAKAGQHEREVAAGYAEAGFAEGGRIKRTDYGQSEPDVVVGLTLYDGSRVTVIGECKARQEGYPSTLKGWHEQNDAYGHRHVEIVFTPIHVKNLPGRGIKADRYTSNHEQEWFDAMALIARLNAEIIRLKEAAK